MLDLKFIDDLQSDKKRFPVRVIPSLYYHFSFEDIILFVVRSRFNYRVLGLGWNMFPIYRTSKYDVYYESKKIEDCISFFRKTLLGAFYNVLY